MVVDFKVTIIPYNTSEWYTLLILQLALLSEKTELFSMIQIVVSSKRKEYIFSNENNFIRRTHEQMVDF